jgi:hypothetical protein
MRATRVSSKTKLASELGISRQMLYAFCRLPDSPPARHGYYSVPEWRKYIICRFRISAQFVSTASEYRRSAAETYGIRKDLNISAFCRIKKDIVKCGPRKIDRFGMVLLTLVAWFSISNHCALGALESSKLVAVHASCHGGAPAPAKLPAKGDAAPCCKLLRATVAKSDQPLIQNYFSGSVQAWVSAALALAEQLHWRQSFELDTGPPFSESFAESVLQRSILAHAPPVIV